MTERDDLPNGRGPTRRRVLLGAGAVGAAGLLAACSSQPSGTPGATAPVTLPTATTPPAPIHTTDIPVGGGTIYPNIATVITQPTAGSFKAFDTTCKHMGCPVSAVSNGLIICPCHNSRYHVADGSVAQGPATAPLTPKTVTVTGDTLTIS